MKDLTLGRLKNTEFPDLYRKFILDNELNSNQNQTMLELAIVFLNSENDDIRKLGYRIVLKYCNMTRNYIPLYDVAINEGFIPIAKFLEGNYMNNHKTQNRFFYQFQSSFEENFRKDSIYLTEEQMNLNKYFAENNDESIAVVAPTSYGKSELIMSLINKNHNKNICIVVPTKSLLAQTKRRIINNKEYNMSRKIVTHPEMYNKSDKNFIAVLTQERLLRLLQQDKELAFDQVVVDEAHNLLNKDERSELLATSLIILNKRNKDFKVKYLTPFLLDTRNLSLNYVNAEYKEFKVTENIKSENYYYYDFLNPTGLMQYDQFMDEHLQISQRKYKSDVSLVLDKSSSKNVIYLNRPIHIESVTKSLMASKSYENNPKILKAIADISSYVHIEYSLIGALKKGIVYHHGSVPDNIRFYIEHLFSTIPEINYIITTSTLLEGVNIPADTMFLLDYRKGTSKLSHSQFKNLVGRVSRFSEIFDNENGSLQKLEPSIYLVKSDYMSSTANISNFLSEVARVDRKYKDTVENVLLDNAEITDNNSDQFDEAIQFIENQEPGTINDMNVQRVKTVAGEVCFRNSIIEFDIMSNEQQIQNLIDSIKNNGVVIDSPKDALEAVASIFISRIPQNDKYQNLKRLEEVAACKFYTMFLNWKIKQSSYNEMIASFMKYWYKLIADKKDTVVYVGKWGDLIKDSPNGERKGYSPLWTDISKKEKVELINLAIVRIKEEQDFLENVLMKFIEALYDLEVLEQNLYSLIKYGTENEDLITIIKNGIGLQTAKLILFHYRKFIEIDNEKNTILIDDMIIDAMKVNEENDIVIYEVMANIRV